LEHPPDVLADARDEADWLFDQPWFQELSARMPEGVSLTVSSREDEENSGSTLLEIREKHSGPQEGAVSPMVGMFSFDPASRTLRYSDPIEGVWTDLSEFLRQRNLDSSDGAISPSAIESPAQEFPVGTKTLQRVADPLDPSREVFLMDSNRSREIDFLSDEPFSPGKVRVAFWYLSPESNNAPADLMIRLGDDHRISEPLKAVLHPTDSWRQISLVFYSPPAGGKRMNFQIPTAVGPVYFRDIKAWNDD